jgi:hypothetical protein
MIKRRRLRLEEWAELYVFIRAHRRLVLSSELPGNSFLSAIDRVAARDYIPSTGEYQYLPYFFPRSPIAYR